VKAQFGADRAAIEGDANLTALYQSYEKWKADYLRSAEGEATLRMSEAYRMGSPGSSGGLRYPTAQESGNVGTAKVAWNKGMTPPGQAALSNPQARKAAAAVSQMQNIYQTIESMPDDESLPDPEFKNVLTRGKQAVYDYLGGRETYVNSLPKDEQQKIGLQRDAIQRTTAMISVALDQGVLREPEYKRAEAALASAGTWGGMKAAMRRAINDTQTRLNALAGAPAGNEVEVSQ
jgi:hypothetical protein